MRAAVVQELAASSSTHARLQQAIAAEQREKADVVAELHALADSNAALQARVQVRRLGEGGFPALVPLMAPPCVSPV